MIYLTQNIAKCSLVPLMDTHGTIYPLTVDLHATPIHLLSLVAQGVTIQGSMVASRQSIKELFEFAARKNITPTIMTYPLSPSGIETAMEELR